MSDFTKVGIESYDWEGLGPGNWRASADILIPDEMKIALEISSAKSEAGVHDGTDEVIIEVQSGDADLNEDWITLVSFFGSSGTVSMCTIGGSEAAGQTVLTVDTTTNFDTIGMKAYIKNSSITLSEVVRIAGYNATSPIVITVKDGLTTGQSNMSMFNLVDQWIVGIPPEFKRCRVLFYNGDDDINIDTRVRLATVTDLEA